MSRCNRHRYIVQPQFVMCSDPKCDLFVPVAAPAPSIVSEFVMVPRRFRKKPVVVEAMQFDGTTASASAVAQWANATDAGDGDPNVDYVTLGDAVSDFICHTLEGPLHASPGDWIIRGIKGEHYPCRDDIFRLTYEPVSDDAA